MWMESGEAGEELRYQTHKEQKVGKDCDQPQGKLNRDPPGSKKAG